MNKPSFGNGYGINRKLKGSSHLGVAIPPHAHGATRKPGTVSGPVVGKTGKRHFAGAHSF